MATPELVAPEPIFDFDPPYAKPVGAVETIISSRIDYFGNQGNQRQVRFYQELLSGLRVLEGKGLEDPPYTQKLPDIENPNDLEIATSMNAVFGPLEDSTPLTTVFSSDGWAQLREGLTRPQNTFLTQALDGFGWRIWGIRAMAKKSERKSLPNKYTVGDVRQVTFRQIEFNTGNSRVALLICHGVKWIEGPLT